MNYYQEVKTMANYLTQIKRMCKDAHQLLNSIEQKAQLIFNNYPNEQTIKLLYKSIELEEQE